MTAQSVNLVLSVVLMAGNSLAQSAAQPVYIESFRKGPTRVAEYTLVANLSLDRSTYTTTIKDSAGADRYQLSVLPHRAGTGTRTLFRGGYSWWT